MTSHFVTCPLCEATCGLEVDVQDGVITTVRGDRDDVFSKGFICPKGASLKALHDDPDRLRTPLIKRDGVFEEASWDEAFAEIDRRLPAIRAEHGADAVAVYVGNPGAHQLGSLLYGRVLWKALGTHNFYTAGTVDQVPKHFSSGYLFGDGLTIPIPDLDRTDFLLLLGANPLVSNGSLLTAPDMRGRLKAIRQRGGKVVVVDPRRTLTAEAADQHLSVRPGTDAMLLAALVHVLFDEGLVRLRHLDGHVNGVDAGAARWSRPFAPEAVAAGRRRRARRRSAISRVRSPLPTAPRCTAASARRRSPSARWPAGWSTSSTCSPATSTARVGRCSRSRRRGRPTRHRAGAVSGTAAGAAGCAGCRR